MAAWVIQASKWVEHSLASWVVSHLCLTQNKKAALQKQDGFQVIAKPYLAMVNF